MHWLTIVLLWLLIATSCYLFAIPSYHIHTTKKSDFWDNFRYQEVPHKTNFNAHQLLAEERLAVIAAVSSMVSKLSRTIYAISPHHRELPYARGYYREHFWLQDETLPEHMDPVIPTDVFLLIDVDYHIDMNYLLSLGHPIICYHFRPDFAARKTTSYAYRFEGDEIVYTVAGGRDLRHKLWNYDVDEVTGYNAGTRIYYEVSSARLSPDHYLTLLIPKYERTLTVRNPLPLKRFVTSAGKQRDNVTIIASRDDPTLISYAMQGPFFYDHVELTREQVLGAHSHIVFGTDRIKSSTQSSLERWFQLNVFKDTKDCQLAALVMLALVGIDDTMRVNTTLPDIFHFGDEAKGVGSKMTSPLVTFPALIPSRSVQADIETVDQRIEGNTARPFLLPQQEAKYLKYATELAECLIPIPARGIPWSQDEVLAHQTKHNQRVKALNYAAWLSPNLQPFTVRNFQKAETYASPKAARAISTVPYDHQIALSQYTLSMKQTLIQHPSFGPGKTPAQLTEQIMNMKTPLSARDFSNFDGTVSHLLNKVVEVIALRWVHPDHAQQFLRLLRREHNAPGRTVYGVRYNTGQTRITGSPDTADHNTLCNMFVSYATLRVAGETAQAAQTHLGLYYGDDSIEPLLPQEAHSKVISDLQLISKDIIVNDGDPIPFLGRLFRHGTSICDPLRAMSKIHLTMSSYPKYQALANKAAGYYATDRLTPIIGAWTRRALELAQEMGVSPDEQTMTPDELERASKAWPQEADTAMELFLATTGYTPNDIEEFETAINNSATLDDLPVLENTYWKVPPEATVNSIHPVQKNLGPYHNNSCFYDAIVATAPELGFGSGAELRHHCREMGVLVPRLGEAAEREHVEALAAFLRRRINITTTAGLESFGSGPDISVFLDLVGEHYMSFKRVSEKRDAVWKKVGHNPHRKGNKWMAAKFKLYMDGIGPMQTVFETSIAPGHFLGMYLPKQDVYGGYFRGKGYRPWTNNVSRLSADHVQEYTDIDQLREPPGTFIWISDAAPMDIDKVTCQAATLRPIAEAMYARWYASTAPLLRMKWFFDGEPPHIEHLVHVDREGMNPLSIECVLTYSREPRKEFNTDAINVFGTMLNCYLHDTPYTKALRPINYAVSKQESKEQAKIKTPTKGKSTKASRVKGNAHQNGAVPQARTSDNPTRLRSCSPHFNKCQRERRDIPRAQGSDRVQPKRKRLSTAAMVEGIYDAIRRISVHPPGGAVDPVCGPYDEWPDNLLLRSRPQCKPSGQLCDSLRECQPRGDSAVREGQVAGPTLTPQPATVVSDQRQERGGDPRIVNLGSVSRFDPRPNGRDQHRGSLASLHSRSPEPISANNTSGPRDDDAPDASDDFNGSHLAGDGTNFDTDRSEHTAPIFNPSDIDPCVNPECPQPDESKSDLHLGRSNDNAGRGDTTSEPALEHGNSLLNGRKKRSRRRRNKRNPKRAESSTGRTSEATS